MFNFEIIVDIFMRQQSKCLDLFIGEMLFLNTFDNQFQLTSFQRITIISLNKLQHRIEKRDF